MGVLMTIHAGGHSGRETLRPLARLSGIHCFNMGHDAHGINMYGVVMILMGNYVGGQSNLGHLSLEHRS